MAPDPTIQATRLTHGEEHQQPRWHRPAARRRCFRCAGARLPSPLPCRELRRRRAPVRFDPALGRRQRPPLRHEVGGDRVTLRSFMSMPPLTVWSFDLPWRGRTRRPLHSSGKVLLSKQEPIDSMHGHGDVARGRRTEAHQLTSLAGARHRRPVPGAGPAVRILFFIPRSASPSAVRLRCTRRLLWPDVRIDDDSFIALVQRRSPRHENAVCDGTESDRLMDEGQAAFAVSKPELINTNLVGRAGSAAALGVPADD